jgi:hypothetical protein
MDLAVDVPINPNGAIKNYDALEVRAFPQERKVLAVLFG